MRIESHPGHKINKNGILRGEASSCHNARVVVGILHDSYICKQCGNFCTPKKTKGE